MNENSTNIGAAIMMILWIMGFVVSKGFWSTFSALFLSGRGICQFNIS